MTEPQTNSIQAVIFDMGGVIMRSEDHGPRRVLAEKHGLGYRDFVNQVLESEDSYRAQKGQMTAEAFWEETGARYGMSGLEFLAAFYAGDRVDQELLSAIRALKPRYKTAMLSNAFDDLRHWIAEWGATDAFDTIIVSAEVGLMKPDPAIYNCVLNELDIAPEASVFVDDLPANIDADRQVGMHGIVFQSREQALADLHALLGDR